MGASCTIKAHVKNSKGEVKESKLFNDLLSQLHNRELAKEYYAVGTDSTFLNVVGDKAKFDENGEITFNSLRKLAGIDIKEEELLANLNKEAKAGTYEYKEAETKLLDFNRSSQFKDDYMATITRTKDGKYQLSVVKKTERNKDKLQKLVGKRALRDRLKFHLQQHKVGVEFIESDDKHQGRYSTENVEQAADGLYYLIKVAKGEHVDENLAEEAGHFAVGSLEESPLVKRIEKLLTQDIQKEVLGNEYENKYLGPNPAREVAGTLVGKAFLNNIDKKTPWGNLAYKIANLAKNIYASFTGDEVMKARLEAEKIARGIAENFMSLDSDNDLNEALKLRETLYNTPLSSTSKTFYRTLDSMKLMVAQLDSLGRDKFSNAMRDILNGTYSFTTEGLDPNDIQAQIIQLEGITTVMLSLADCIGPGKETTKLLEACKIDNTKDFYSSVVTIGHNLQQVRKFVNNSLEIVRLVEHLVGTEDKNQIISAITDPATGNTIVQNVRTVLKNLRELNSALLQDLMQREKEFYIKFLETSLGSKYVTLSARTVWNIGKKKDKNSDAWLIKLDEKKVTVEEMVESLDEDIGFFSRFLKSMSNNPDIVGQIIDRVTKMANKAADDNTNRHWDELKVLKTRLERIGVTSDMLYERFDDGTLTGNIISDKHWGKYEKDWEEFKAITMEEFYKDYPEMKTKSKYDQAIAWNLYFHDYAKSWHKAHSVWNKVSEKYIPNHLYNNDDYYIFEAKYPGISEWLDDYFDLKQRLDNEVGRSSTLTVRAPQFKGSFTNQVSNHTKGLAAGTKAALRTKIADTFCESSEDTDYGNDLTYNTSESDPFGNALSDELEKIHRVPVYGINKLQDMTQLSTDIFYSTLAYASMANTHLALSTIVDACEVGKEVLSERRVGGTKRERDTEESRAFARYSKFIDKQVYGISSTKHKLGPLVLEKLLGWINRMGAFRFLGGNVVGGAVNTGTGLIEIFKEAATGEFFSAKDFAAANSIYFSNFVQNWAEYGKVDKDNKLSLFFRHFNVHSDNREDYRNWNTRRGARLGRILGGSIYLAYKSGDHYMQSMSYLAVAQKIKLYDIKGNEVNLYDAYTTVDNVDVNGNKNGKKLILKTKYYKTKDFKKTADIIDNIIAKISNVKGSPIQRLLSKEELDYLNSISYKFYYDLANLNEAITGQIDYSDEAKEIIDAYVNELNTEKENFEWSDTDESLFMDKCREINNRLHGIYNNQDKVDFQRNFYGSAVTSMRSYALGMLERRLSAEHYSAALGTSVEGSWNTVLKTIAPRKEVPLGFWNMMGALLLPYNKRIQNHLRACGFSDFQVNNLKRNFNDCMILLTLSMIMRLTGGILEGDDDKKYKKNTTLNDLILGNIYYYASRLSGEQFNPKQLWQDSTLRDLIPAGMGALEDYIGLAWEIGGAAIANEKDSRFYYQSSRKGVYEKGEAKFKRHLIKTIPFVKNVNVIEHPVEAKKAFDYYSTKVR